MAITCECGCSSESRQTPRDFGISKSVSLKVSQGGSDIFFDRPLSNRQWLYFGVMTKRHRRPTFDRKARMTFWSVQDYRSVHSNVPLLRLEPKVSRIVLLRDMPFHRIGEAPKFRPKRDLDSITDRRGCSLESGNPTVRASQEFQEHRCFILSEPRAAIPNPSRDHKWPDRPGAPARRK